MAASDAANRKRKEVMDGRVDALVDASSDESKATSCRDQVVLAHRNVMNESVRLKEKINDTKRKKE